MTEKYVHPGPAGINPTFAFDHVRERKRLPADSKHVEKCKRAIAILEESYIVGNDVALYDKQPGHCDHEGICPSFIDGSPIAYKDHTPCVRNYPGCKLCKIDTRKPASEAEPMRRDRWKQFADSQFKPPASDASAPTHMTSTIMGLPDPEGDCKGCESGSCCEACQTWIHHHDAAIAAAAIAEHDKRPRPACEGCQIGSIIEQKRGCLTCRDPECPIWQTAEQNCWKSQDEHDQQVREKVLVELKGKFADRYDSGLKNPMVILDAAMHDLESLRAKEP